MVKLAEALADRKALADRISALTFRAQKSVIAMEGRSPAESASDLLDELTQALVQWEKRVVQINQANSRIMLATEESLMEGLARRDRLTRQLGILTELMETATGGGRHERMHMMPGVAPMVPAIDLGALQRQIDRVSQERLTLDLAIQEAGWTHDL